MKDNINTSVLETIKLAISSTDIETYPNIVYQIKHSDPEQKALLKSSLNQGDTDKPHTIVEIDFIKKMQKLSRRQKNLQRYSKMIHTKSIDTEEENSGKIHDKYKAMFVGNGDEPDIKIYNSSILIYGKYIKLSRNMTQSPLIIEGQLKTVHSVSDFHKEFELFFAADTVKFMASGREDIDVRCLGGRPFILEVLSPKKNLFAISMNISLHKDIDIIDCYIVSKQIKEAINSDESSKFYALIVFSEIPIVIQGLYHLKQKTPLRVLHRRANLIRDKQIEVLDCTEHKRDDGYYYEINIKASAGAYIKEWVNGDFDRTLPNLNADILTLDFVSIDKPFDRSNTISPFRLSKI